VLAFREDIDFDSDWLEGNGLKPLIFERLMEGDELAPFGVAIEQAPIRPE
jgi:hypothetical protein